MENRRSILIMAAAVMAGLVIQADAANIPLQLPRPDGKPGDTKKPVKVYILSGQSNMVGMGDISGARPEYPSVFLSADPAIVSDHMPVGTSRRKGGCRWNWGGVSALGTHGIYQSADPKAEKGAVAAVYKGAYDAKADYSKLTPAKTATVALGTVSAFLPALDGPCTPVVTAFIDVPVRGIYTLHAGFEDSTYAIVTLEGKEVYRKELGGKPVLTKVTLEQGKRYPIVITYFKGRSAAFWMEQVDLEGKGDLVTLTKKDKKFPYLVDDKSEWTVRNDVYFREARLTEGGKCVPLSAEANKKCLPKCNSIGPEVGFGYVMGTFYDEQVLLIKTAQGNRSLRYDFRPPSSGKTSDSKFEGEEYRLMVKGVHETLNNIAKIVPGYKGQGYEVVGFGWFQGHKDSGSSKEDYEKCLVDLIKDLRKEFKAQDMKAVVATVGFHGYRLMNGPWKGVWEAQMAVGDPKQHPEFAGTVASVDTRDFWREVGESPRSQDYHYNRNPETYLLVGEAMGRAMVRMLGGEAEAIPKSDREARLAAAIAAEAAKPKPTPEQLAAETAAIRPMLIDGMLERFITDPRNQPALQGLLKDTKAKSARASEYLDDIFDDAVTYFQAASVHDYDWKPFGANMKDGTWEYLGFNLQDSPYKNKAAVSTADEAGGDAEDNEVAQAKKGKGGKEEKKSPASVKVTPPSGMENWFAPEFDPKKAGWKTGPAPFSMKVDEMIPTNMMWLAKYPLYPLKRTLPNTVCGNDVLLMRGMFEFPPARDGYRYRVRVDGSIHDNSGEGFAVYINGKLLAEEKNGVTAWRAQGLRGSHISADLLNEFKGGKVTIAVANFPMSNYDPARFIPVLRPLSVWVEEMKIPTFN